MSKVRVLVGTRKGAFVLNSDGKRERWEVSGPHFAGWEIYHLKGSPVDPDRLYASQSSGWFGQLIQRSNDGGKPGRRWATSSRMKALRAPTSGTTALRTPGSSNGFGIWNRLKRTRTPFTPEWKTQPYSIRAMEARTGRSCPVCVVWIGARMATRSRRDVPAHHHPRSQQSRTHLHRNFRGGCIPIG